MSHANGLCHHNNQMGYCPSCVREKSMRGMRGMGATCPEGYYEAKLFGFNTGQCVPDLGTLVEGAQGGIMQTVGTGVANSPGTQAAATSAAASALGTKIVTFYKNNPIMAIGLTVAVGGLLVYGTMSFLRGR